VGATRPLSRRAKFLGMRRAIAEFFYGSAESQPNFSNVPAVP